jgi:tetraacyldisaccharide 4'-kinase
LFKSRWFDLESKAIEIIILLLKAVIINNIMLRTSLIKILLLPFSLIYGIAVSFRNWMYNKGLIKGVKFDLPVISVGNLSVGGAGKTPHIEYLILLLKDYIQVGTMSRGYKRKTTGFLEVTSMMDADTSGDEPLQFKRKFPEVAVSVSESRSLGIPRLVGLYPDLQCILLDDAFQHRGVIPGLNILLTDYNHLYTKDFLLPSGRLREWPSAAKRADIIIVTKCPSDPSLIDRVAVLKELKPLPHQKVYFSYYEYGHPYYIYNGNQRVRLNPELNVLLVSAIAGTDYLTQYLEKHTNVQKSLSFEDHHDFTNHEMGQLKKVYDHMGVENRIILTTEKDAIRMDKHRPFLQQEQLPVFALPLRVKFHGEDGALFDEEIKNHLIGFTA